MCELKSATATAGCQESSACAHCARMALVGDGGCLMICLTRLGFGDFYIGVVPKKTSNINIRISDDLKDSVEFLKLCPGGLTKYIEDALRLVRIDYALLNAWRSNRDKK